MSACASMRKSQRTRQQISEACNTDEAVRMGFLRFVNTQTGRLGACQQPLKYQPLASG